MYGERQLCAGAVQEGPLVTISSTAAFLPVAWFASLFHKHGRVALLWGTTACKTYVSWQPSVCKSSQQLSLGGHSLRLVSLEGPDAVHSP